MTRMQLILLYVVILILTVVFSIPLITVFTNMLTQPSTIANMVGLFCLLFFPLVAGIGHFYVIKKFSN